MAEALISVADDVEMLTTYGCCHICGEPRTAKLWRCVDSRLYQLGLVCSADESHGPDCEDV